MKESKLSLLFVPPAKSRQNGDFYGRLRKKYYTVN
jgi:hypothetical protein